MGSLERNTLACVGVRRLVSKMIRVILLRRLGRTEMRVKSLGLGAAWLARASEAETILAIHRAIELGINYIDTYPRESEKRWGRALVGGLREEVYLQAKVSPPTVSESKDFSAVVTRRSVGNSPKQL